MAALWCTPSGETPSSIPLPAAAPPLLHRRREGRAPGWHRHGPAGQGRRAADPSAAFPPPPQPAASAWRNLEPSWHNVAGKWQHKGARSPYGPSRLLAAFLPRLWLASCSHGQEEGGDRGDSAPQCVLCDPTPSSLRAAAASTAGTFRAVALG